MTSYVAVLTARQHAEEVRRVEIEFVISGDLDEAEAFADEFASSIGMRYGQMDIERVEAG